MGVTGPHWELHDSPNLIDPEFGDSGGSWDLGPPPCLGPNFGNLVVNYLGKPGLERKGVALLGTRIRELDLPLSADIQGECGNPRLGNFAAGIWLKLRY